MSRLTRFALAKSALTILLAIAVLGFGVFASRLINMELMPDLDFPVVTIMTGYPGASSADVSEQVSKPVEQTAASASGLRHLQSTSTEGLSIVVAEFEFGTNMRDATAKIANDLGKASFPAGVAAPQVLRVNLNDTPVVQLSLSGNVSADELEKIAREQFVPALTSINGVYTADVIGGQTPRIAVSVDPEKAANLGVSLQQIAAVLQANNLTLPAGSVAIQGQSLPVRTVHEFASLTQLQDLVVGATAVASSKSPTAATPVPFPSPAPVPQPQVTATGAPRVYLVREGDTLGAIAANFGTTVSEIARLNSIADPNVIYVGQSLTVPQAASQGRAPGQQAPAAVGQPPDAAPTSGGPADSAQDGTRPVHMSEVATIKLEPAPSAGIARTNGRPGISILVTKTQDANIVKVADAVDRTARQTAAQLGGKILVYTVRDESTAVRSSVNGLLREGMLGAVFAVLVILLFLWSARSTVAAAVSIPLSILAALLLLWWRGFTLNIMTLSGLAVAVGRVVDDAVVVLENVHRHGRQGASPGEAAIQGTAQVASPITSSTLTTVAVFLPLGLVGGLVGEIFRPFAFTVTFALLASLLVALTVVPVLARWLVRPQTRAQRRDRAWLPRAYTHVLRWALRHRAITLATAAALFCASLAIVPLIPTSFLAGDQKPLFTVHIDPPPGASVESTLQQTKKLEDLVSHLPTVETYQTSLGSAGNGSAAMLTIMSGHSVGGASILVRLRERSDVSGTVQYLRRAVLPLQGKSRITISPEQAVESSRLSITVSGADPAAVRQASRRAADALKDTADLANVTTDAQQTTDEIAIQVDPNRARDHGLTTAQVAGAVRAMVSGQNVTRVRVAGGDPIDVFLSVPQQSLATLDKLQRLPFGAPDPVPLEQIATVARQPGAAQVTRVDQRPAATISADIPSNNTGAVTSRAKERIKAAGLPGGVTVAYGGVAEQMADSFSAMGLGLVMAVLLVYLVMVLFFGSLLDPLVILFSLPLAAIGVTPALLLTGRALDISAMIGLLMLVGIVVTNAIVLLDFVKRLLAEGRSSRDAILEAGRTRLRPILMTALATICALMPLGLGLSEGSIIAASLATVVIGGLFSSTLLTLVIVPVTYSFIADRRTRRTEANGGD